MEPVGITPAKRGFFGETWRIETSEGVYFVKLDYSPLHQQYFRDGLAVVDHLVRHGIGFVSRVIPTLSGKNHCMFDGAVLGILDWCEGENIETDETKQTEYTMLARVYSVPLDGLQILRADLSDREAATFRQQRDLIRDPKLTAFFAMREPLLSQRAARLTYLAQQCQQDMTHFYLTHGDAGGNLIVAPTRCYLVDWDYAQLAPPERDAWVMVHKPWAQDMFNHALADAGVEYQLRPERLTYYAYNWWFTYLNDYLTRYLETGIVPPDLYAYFDGWIEERIDCADRLLVHRVSG